MSDFLALPFVEFFSELKTILSGKRNFATPRSHLQFPQEHAEMCYSFFKEDFDMFKYDKKVPTYTPVDGKGEFFKNEHGRHINTNIDIRGIKKIQRRKILL